MRVRAMRELRKELMVTGSMRRGDMSELNWARMRKKREASWTPANQTEQVAAITGSQMNKTWFKAFSSSI